MEKTSAYYIKTLILSILLFFESFLLTNSINEYIKSQKFFAPPIEVLVVIFVLLYLIFITNALLAGSWGKWEQYVFPILPIIAGIITVTFTINSAYAVVIASVAFLIMAYEMFLASQLKRQLIVFNPRWVLRFSSKGISLSFSIMAAVLVVVSAGKQPELNIGESIGEFVDDYLTVEINDQISEQMQSELNQQQIDRLSAFGLDPSKFTYIEDTDIFRPNSGISAPQLSLKDTVTQEVNKLIEPYERFVNPIIAILVFGLLQFLGMLAFFLFNVSVEILFWLAKKAGLLKVQKVAAEREILHF